MLQFKSRQHSVFWLLGFGSAILLFSRSFRCFLVIFFWSRRSLSLCLTRYGVVILQKCSGLHWLTSFLLKFVCTGFARTVCAMSALSLLDIFIRIQLNILGRHVYFDTARDLMNPEVHILTISDTFFIFFHVMSSFIYNNSQIFL